MGLILLDSFHSRCRWVPGGMLAKFPQYSRSGGSSQSSSAGDCKEPNQQQPTSASVSRASWRRESDPHKRRSMKKSWWKLVRERRRRRQRAHLKQAVERHRHCLPPVSLLLDSGERSSSREDWRAAAFQFCENRYADSTNDLAQQKRRAQILRDEVIWWEFDGLHLPPLDLITVFDARAAMRRGKACGTDGIPSDAWKSLPLLSVLQFCVCSR